MQNIATSIRYAQYAVTISRNVWEKCCNSAMFQLILALIQSTKLICPRLPSSTPTTILDLSPTSFKVIAALGDSISAGLALNSSALLYKESRGLTFFMGGDEDAESVASFLKQVKQQSSSLVGPSVGSHGVELCFGLICPAIYHKGTM